MPDRYLTRLRGGWAATWYDEQGGRHRYALSASDKKEAERELARFNALQDGQEAKTVRQLWELYRKDRAGRRIAESMDFTGRIILPELGDYRPTDISVEVCRAYAAKRKAQGKKVGTYWTELNHLQIMFSWAFKTDRITKPVFIERPAKPPARNVRLTKAEANRLIKNAKAPHVELAIALMLATAARSGAIKDLTWDRVDFETGLIDLAIIDDHTQHRKGRAVVPMNAALRQRLVKARKEAQTDYVIEWAGRPIASLKRGFRRAAADAGLVDVTPHTLRHTAATWMAERGISMQKIAAYLGHSDSRTTEKIYARFTPGHLADAADALDFEEEDVTTGADEPEDDDNV